MQVTPEEMDAVLDAHFAAETAKDLPALLGTLTEDADHDVVGFPVAAIRGHEAIGERYEQMFADFTDDRVAPVRRYHGAGFVVDESLVTATAAGAPFGIPGLDREVTFRLLHVCEFEDGLMSRENVWIDALSILGQLDAFPKAA